MAWGDDGRIVVSPVDSFETAPGRPVGLDGRWITDGHDKRFAAAPMLRKSFDVTGEVRDARLYMSAAAYGKMRLNGKPVTPEPALNRVIRITTNGTCTVPMT